MGTLFSIHRPDRGKRQSRENVSLDIERRCHILLSIYTVADTYKLNVDARTVRTRTYSLTKLPSP